MTFLVLARCGQNVYRTVIGSELEVLENRIKIHNERPVMYFVATYFTR